MSLECGCDTKVRGGGEGELPVLGSAAHKLDEKG